MDGTTKIGNHHICPSHKEALSQLSVVKEYKKPLEEYWSEEVG